MSSQSGRESYVRVAREVQPTPHLRKFLSRVAELSYEYLPARDRTVVRTAASLDEIKAEGLEPQLREVPVSAANIRTADNLKVTLFERRLVESRKQKPKGNQQRLLNLLYQLDLTQLLGADDPSPELLTVRSSHITETTFRHNDQQPKSTSRHASQQPNEREFSLVIDDGPSRWRLIKEHEAVHRQIGEAAGRNSEQIAQTIAQDRLASPFFIPLFTVSRWSDKDAVQVFIEQATEAFIERVNLSGITEPMVELNLFIPEIDSKSR